VVLLPANWHCSRHRVWPHGSATLRQPSCLTGHHAAWTAASQVFSEDEELARDTTEVQLAAGRDPQGIPWELTQFTRDGYRAVRNESYHNYFNLEGAVEAAQPRIDAEALQPRPGGRFFDFYRNWRQPRSSIVHFQLRNLLWATSGLCAVLIQPLQAASCCKLSGHVQLCNLLWAMSDEKHFSWPHPG
jgi:hypothetical protein